MEIHMKIAKKLALALTAVSIFCAQAAPSFAAPKDDWIEVLSYQHDDGSIWDYILGWF
jgi:hypothetical protein